MAIAFVAERGKQHNGNVSTFNVTVGSLTPGNHLLVIVSITKTVLGYSVSSVTDNGAGSAWQIDQNLATSSTFEGIAIVSTIIGATPPTTVTVNLSGAAISSGVKIEEFSGIAASAWFDAGNTGTFAATTTPTSASATPGAAGRLAVVAFAPDGAEASFTPGTIGGVGATQAGTPINSGTPDCCVEYVLSAASGSQSGTGTLGSSLLGADLIAFYKAAAAVTDHNLSACGAGH